ncbi:hypothetical protein [Corynebacterium tapiri]|uniref:hypothetical protein n=1 Tax=Corynebacterium tapiri TaxID=1448266 RepID=UPI0015D5B8EF|nr:hypothetical protein [Corynebacterium tapiri]
MDLKLISDLLGDFDKFANAFADLLKAPAAVAGLIENTAELSYNGSVAADSFSSFLSS